MEIIKTIRKTMPKNWREFYYRSSILVFPLSAGVYSYLLFSWGRTLEYVYFMNFVLFAFFGAPMCRFMWKKSGIEVPERL